MTLSEFKAWFEGYTEGLEAAPTKAQFERIKEKVAAINGAPITQTVYLRDYYHSHPYWNYLHQPQTTFATTASGQAPVGQMTLTNSVPQTAYFNSVDAMYALGKAEASN